MGAYSGHSFRQRHCRRNGKDSRICLFVRPACSAENRAFALSSAGRVEIQGAWARRTLFRYPRLRRDRAFAKTICIKGACADVSGRGIPYQKKEIRRSGRGVKGYDKSGKVVPVMVKGECERPIGTSYYGRKKIEH